MTTTPWGFGLAGALLAGSLFAQAAETPLARLEADGGKFGWDSITLGMSSVQVERRTGVTLAMQERSASSTEGACMAFSVTVERGTLRLTLGFPSSRPGAKLQSVYVHFEGYQIAAKREALVRELKEKVVGATYQPPKIQPPPAEVDDPAPSYLLPGGEYAARLVPGDGLWITLRECLD
ncbi:MAG: hypothetical protein ABIV06_04045 [Thermoanaerobaculia bacterium]